MTAPGPMPAGLRERRRQRTRAAIQAAGLALFTSRGYEATTCEQIAAAAEVSPATFFRYFPTKEDVVFSDDHDGAVLALLHDRPAGESPLLAARRSLAAGLRGLSAAEVEMLRERVELLVAVPALRARFYEQQRAAEALLAGELAVRMGAAPGDLEVRAVAAAIGATAFLAVEEWATRGGDLPELVDRALAALGERLTARRRT